MSPQAQDPLFHLATATRGSAAPFRAFFAVWLVAVIWAAIYFLRPRKEIFGGRGGDRSTDSPAAGNLRMWMIILILLHAAVILTLMICEV